MSRTAVVTVPSSVLRFLSETTPWQEVEQGIPDGFVHSSREDLALMRRLRVLKRDERGSVRLSVTQHSTADDLRYWATVVAGEAWSAHAREAGSALVRRLDDVLGVPSGRRYGL